MPTATREERAFRQFHGINGHVNEIKECLAENGPYCWERPLFLFVNRFNRKLRIGKKRRWCLCVCSVDISGGRRYKWRRWRSWRGWRGRRQRDPSGVYLFLCFCPAAATDHQLQQFSKGAKPRAPTDGRPSGKSGNCGYRWKRKIWQSSNSFRCV